MLGFRADPERRFPPSPLPPVPLLSVLGRSGNNQPSVISAPRPAASLLRFSPSLWCHDLHLGSSLPLRGGHAPLPPGQREPSSYTQGLSPAVSGTSPPPVMLLESFLKPSPPLCLLPSLLPSCAFPDGQNLPLGFGPLLRQPAQAGFCPWQM